MNDLPNELVHEILSYLSLKALKTKTKRISKFWNEISKQLAEEKLANCKYVLENLQNYPIEVLADPESRLDAKILSDMARLMYKGDKHPFKAWCLGNFEYPGDSNVVTGIELKLESLDSQLGSFVFVPTGMLTFGIWVNHVGFFPITAAYESSIFSFPPKVDPLLRFWFHEDSKNSPGADFILNQYNQTERLSKAKDISKKNGVHENVLTNSFGNCGKIVYQIISEGANTLSKDGILPSSTGHSLDELIPRDNVIFQHLEMQEKKTMGVLLKLYISPEAIISVSI